MESLLSTENTRGRTNEKFTPYFTENTRIVGNEKQFTFDLTENMSEGQKNKQFTLDKKGMVNDK